MDKKCVYLDHNATTPLHPQVKAVIQEALELFGNPSSLHQFGREARKHVEDARERVAAFINASADEIIFVGSGSEANNTVLSMISCCSQRMCACPSARGREIITTTIEHPCVMETSKCVQDRGFPVTFLGVDQHGKVKLDELNEKMNDRIGLVSIMTANNEIGTIQDIKAIAQLVHKRQGALFHTDAVQAVGKIPVDVKDLDVDFLTFSGHKIYGPKGIGVLYVKKGVTFCPLIRGGHQERGRRAGTENTLGIIALGKAIEMREKEMADEEKRLRPLKEKLKSEIEKKIPGINFNGHPTDCLVNTLSVSFDGAEGEAILLYLDLEGIAVSTGSACASGSLDPSHVLLATGLPVERAHSAIRFSMGRETTENDIDYLLAKMPGIIEKIRGMSTVYSQEVK